MSGQVKTLDENRTGGDVLLVPALIIVCTLYGASFFLPVKDDSVWKVLDVLEGLLRGSWSAPFYLMLPNLLLWIGLACIYFRLPHFSFLAGLFATAIALHRILW